MGGTQAELHGVKSKVFKRAKMISGSNLSPKIRVYLIRCTIIHALLESNNDIEGKLAFPKPNDQCMSRGKCGYKSSSAPIGQLSNIPSIFGILGNLLLFSSETVVNVVNS